MTLRPQFRVTPVHSWRSKGELVIAHEERYRYADFGGTTCEGSGIYRITADGRDATALAIGKPACDAFQEALSVALDPDGRSIVYSVRVLPNSSRLVRLRLGAAHADSLPAGCATYLENPAVSPQGDRIAAAGICDRAASNSIYVSNANGGDLRPLMPSDGVVDADPAWSPEGARIAFTHGGHIAIIDTSGRSMRELVAGDYPAWSPDGRWIAFLARDPSDRLERQIHLIRFDNSGERVLFVNHVHTTYSVGWGRVREGGVSAPLVWAPDGSALAFGRGYEKGTSIWRVDIANGALGAITAPAR